MLILLPPSETKRAGGNAAPLVLDDLALPSLAVQRAQAVTALAALSETPEEAARVLGLSARQLGEIAVNAAIATAPTMPAIDRYTGVLYDAVDAASLTAPARRWLGSHVLIQSAPFGPVGALDPIPAYRLAAGAALPGLPPLRRHWAEPVTAALAAASPSFVLDLRSEAYVALGPVPAGIRSVYLRVVTRTPEGSVRALNHFNKHAKGDLVRALALARPRIGSVGAFRRWASTAGFSVEDGAAGELALVV
ncbi:peroxide stress protein YaaA [Microbacterium sp. NPDC089189]|uniref:YaaA family protein n=1 Tax=Microbacterium sp. NPDC089189 TaxID=3154972 RepID=UPI00342BD7CD